MPPVKTKKSDSPEELAPKDLAEKGYIYYEKSLTKNLGNYESAKITVGVSLPLENPHLYKGAVQTALEIADDLVTGELEIQVKEITE
jgi:hypothetical protein